MGRGSKWGPLEKGVERTGKKWGKVAAAVSKIRSGLRRKGTKHVGLREARR